MGVAEPVVRLGGSTWVRAAGAFALAGAIAGASLSCATQAQPAAAPAAAPLAAVAVPPAEPVATQLPPREIARRASAYTVFVRSGPAYGAGVLFDERGHVITCNHVVLDTEATEIRFEGSTTPIKAKVVERDADLDLALLQIEGDLPVSATPATTWGFDAIDAIERGDEVYAMGSPRKMRFSFHRGIVSFTGRPFERVFFLQTDLAMNPGSSGGPVLNDRGELVGIAAFILRDGQGLSFALPIDYALRRFRSLGDDRARRERVAGFETWLGKQNAAEHTAVTHGQQPPASPASDVAN